MGMEDLVTYICGECRFRFKRKANWSGNMCPNCGRESTFERGDQTIDRMLKDASYSD